MAPSYHVEFLFPSGKIADGTDASDATDARVIRSTGSAAERNTKHRIPSSREVPGL
jgi:hypothetical protein